MPCEPLDGQRVTHCRRHRALARRAAADGMVLLKNTGGCLPLAAGTKLAVFGKGQVDYVVSGGGSSSVTVFEVPDVLEALREKHRSGRLQLLPELGDFYKEYKAKHPGRCGGLAEPRLPGALIKAARDFTDTALIVISRWGTEGGDRTEADYCLSGDESALVRRISKAFPKCIVCFNVGELIGLQELEDNKNVKSILLAWQAGGEGARAIADVLCGAAAPGGRLTDTIAKDISDYPSAAGFHASKDYVEYNEDIFVGYRYFETVPGASERVLYPFGYGLGYTDFEMTFDGARRAGDRVSFGITVRNTGSVSGRQVVQVYCEPPRGALGKPARVLAGFAKTGIIRPGESRRISVVVDLKDLASYDDEGAVRASSWVLEKGEYRFYAGANVRDAVLINRSITLEENRILETLSPRCLPAVDMELLCEDGSHRKAPARTSVPPEDRSLRPLLPADGMDPDEQYCHTPFSKWGPPTIPQLIDVAEGRLSLGEFMDSLADEELVRLLGGQPNRGCANTYGVGNLPSHGVPNVMTADGPVGLRFKPECGVTTTAFPCATAMACSWDKDLMREIGRAIGEEVKENNIGIWLGPAINIHRSPLCGRNFEYYSEDPLLTGILAVSMVEGAQSLGIAACPKHFAANNKETNRRDSDSRLSERALREIYLKAFEMCVKRAKPLTLMSSYNILNGVRVSEDRELLTGILRVEWGYDGPVFTDWYTRGAQFREIAAGIDLKMGCGMPEHTMEMIKKGALSMDDVRTCAKRVLELILKLE